MQAKDNILLFQAADAPLGATGYVMGNLTENSHSIENSLLDEETKAGRILGYGNNKESFEYSAFAERGDPSQKAVLDAIRAKKLIKVWDVDLHINESGTHDSTFAWCAVESIEKSSSEGFVELSGTLQVLGESVEGTIPLLPPEVIEYAKYGFEAPGESTGEYPNETTAAPTP